MSRVIMCNHCYEHFSPNGSETVRYYFHRNTDHDPINQADFCKDCEKEFLKVLDNFTSAPA